MRHLYGDEGASFGIKDSHPTHIARMDISATWLDGLGTHQITNARQPVKNAIAWMPKLIRFKPWRLDAAVRSAMEVSPQR